MAGGRSKSSRIGVDFGAPDSSSYQSRLIDLISHGVRGFHNPSRRCSMRVMVMVKATAQSEAGKMPSTELLAAMGNFNEELVKAGVMLAGEGLQPSSRGKRVRFSGANRTVI